MKLALISSREVKNIVQFIPDNCTEILTNIKGLTVTGITVIYEPDLDILIRNSDYVTVLCSRKIKKRPPIISRCKRYAKSFEFLIID